jgi:hypothetical protein
LNSHFRGRHRNSGEHQSVSDGVIKLKLLAKEHNRHDRAEYGRQVHERSRAIGADQLDAAVEEQVAEQRRKYADVDEAQETLAVEDHRATGGKLRSHCRNQ